MEALMTDIRKLEEISMNAWPGVYVRFYDGWVMRCAGGYTNRANSILPLYESREDLMRKINDAELFCSSRGLQTIFKMTSISLPSELDRALEGKGYVERDRAIVMTKELSGATRDLSDLDIFTTPSREWLGSFTRLSKKAAENEYWLGRILDSIVPEAFYVILKKSEETVGCAMAVREDEYFGLFGITIGQEYRRMGYGKELTEKLLALAGREGARIAYLQVDIVNDVAIKLYSSLGFEEAYQYWYRVKV